MRAAAAGITAALVPCCWLLAPAGRAEVFPPAGVRAGTGAASTSDPADVPGSGRRGVPGEFASAKSVQLLASARRVVAWAYHESLFGTALPLQPLGRPAVVANPAFEPPRGRGERPRYIVLPSRGRGTPATSAIDIVLRRGTPVVAPVTGIVVDASPYRLYCRRVDRRVIIKPAVAPRLRVVVFHLERVPVRRGDRVTAGETRIGVPRVFAGLTAQYDAYVPGDHPHVHVEVERRPTLPLPGCKH